MASAAHVGARTTAHTINAEIVKRLEASYQPDTLREDIAEIKQAQTKLSRVIETWADITTPAQTKLPRVIETAASFGGRAAASIEGGIAETTPGGKGQGRKGQGRKGQDHD
jgi:hypothetical protein